MFHEDAEGLGPGELCGEAGELQLLLDWSRESSGDLIYVYKYLVGELRTWSQTS